MKTTFKLAFVACLMVLSSACHAQKPIPDIDQAFDKFVQDLSQDDLVTSSTMNTYNIGMMKGFEFAVPRKKQKMVDTFHKALLSNSRLAYISLPRKRVLPALRRIGWDMAITIPRPTCLVLTRTATITCSISVTARILPCDMFMPWYGIQERMMWYWAVSISSTPRIRKPIRCHYLIR